MKSKPKEFKFYPEEIMYISKRKVYALIIYMIFGLLMYTLINTIQTNPIQNWIDIINVLILILLFLQIIIMRMLNMNIVSLIGIFILFSYLMHFGNLFLLSSSFREMGLGTHVIRHVDQETFQNAVIYCIYFIYALFCGIIFASKHQKIKQHNDSIKDWNLKVSRITGTILFTLGLPAFIFITYKEMNVAFTGDYFDTFELQQEGIPSFINFLVTMMNVGVGLLLIGYKNKLKISQSVLFVSILLQIISTLSGGRGSAVISIVVYLYIYHRFVNKFRFINVVIFLVLGYVSMAFLSAIAAIRDFGMDMKILYEEFLLKLTSENIFFTTLNEFGGILLTQEIAMEKIPGTVEPGFGLTYINSILNLIGFNIGDVQIGSFVSLIDIGAMGGSYIGEAYYNFLYWGWLIGIIYGFFLSKVSVKIENIVFTHKYITIGYYLPFFLTVLWWIRDSFHYLAKISIAGALFFLIVHGTTKYILLKYGSKRTRYPHSKAIQS